jgi:hypothetical protein
MFIPCSGTALHEVQAEIENLQSKQEAKEDILQGVEGRQVIDDDSSTEWEDIEHRAEQEPSTQS